MVGGNFFSLVTNSSLTLKMNICILELSILFSKDLLFLYYIKVRGFWFFPIFLIYLFFYFTLDMSLISWCIIYDTQFIFFPKIDKATFTNQFNLFLGSKLIFLVDFIKNKKYKKRLKYFARIKLCKKGKLKLGKI